MGLRMWDETFTALGIVEPSRDISVEGMEDVREKPLGLPFDT